MANTDPQLKFYGDHTHRAIVNFSCCKRAYYFEDMPQLDELRTTHDCGERCKHCRNVVKLMVQKGTGFCSQKCARDYAPFHRKGQPVL